VAVAVAVAAEAESRASVAARTILIGESIEAAEDDIIYNLKFISKLIRRLT
jgi:hypothetical protein